MNNKNEHISKYLDYYLSLTEAPEYAVLLRGDWGSGKSWFIKDYIDNNPELKFLKVSLYGIISYKEIEDSFFEQIHPILGSKAAKLTGKILSKVVKATMKIDLDGDSKGDDVSATASIPEFVTKFDKSAENRVLVFDDLERCSIRTTDLLGYINQYVENYGLKVILVANEEEIINKKKESNTKETSEYLRIKEKLIGKRFDVQSDVDTALGVFISGVRSIETKKLLLKHKQILLNAYRTGGYNNLRHLKQSVMDFDRFSDFLPNDLERKEGLFEHILGLFFSISIELKKGEIQTDDIPKIFLMDYLISRKEVELTTVQKVNKKYAVLGLYHQPFEPILLTGFFKNGTIAKSDLSDSIHHSIYYAEDRKATWAKLWRYEELEDQDFINYVGEVWTCLQNNAFEEKYALAHSVGLLIYFSKVGLFNESIENILRTSKSNIDALHQKGGLLLQKHEQFNTNAAFGVAYYGGQDTDFRNFIEYFSDKVRDAQVDNLPQKASDLLQELKQNDSSFIIRTTLTNSTDSLYYDIPVLIHIPVDNFVAAYLALPNIRKASFFSSLKKRYEISNFIQQLQPEKEWWEQVRLSLQAISHQYTGKVSGQLLSAALKEIEEYKRLLG